MSENILTLQSQQGILEGPGREWLYRTRYCTRPIGLARGLAGTEPSWPQE